jgi:O-antigen/teichoic acid export membrane protein
MNRSPHLALAGTLATEGTLLLLGVLTGFPTARLLLPEGRGALAAVLFWPQLFAGIGLLSLNEAATYRIGANPERAPVIAASSFWLALILAEVTTLAGYVLIPFLLGEGRAHLVSLARIYLLVFIPFNFMALSLLASDHGGLYFARYNTLRPLVPLSYLIGLLALWATGHVSVAWVVAVNCAGTVLVAVVRLILVERRIMTVPSLGEAVALLGLAGRFHLTTVLLLLAAQADQFVVLTLWDNAALGKYVAAFTIASSGLAVVSGASYKVLFPHLAHVRDPATQAGLLARGVRHAALLLVAFSLLLALGIPRLVPVLFGPAFQDAVNPARVLVVAYPFIALKVIAIQGLRGLGESRPGSMAAALSLGVFLLLAWPLGNALGLVGVGAGLWLANVGALGYLTYHLRRRHHLALPDLWGLTRRTMSEIWDGVAQLNPFGAKTT